VGLPIYKMTGSGNDFVMVDARLSAPGEWSATDMHALCARGTGVGADGVVFVGPGSQEGAVRMVYFNADGSRAAMCGNAALCSTRFAARLGLAPAAGMRLETDAGVFESRCPGDGDAELHLAAVTAPAPVPGLDPGPGEHAMVLASVGVPHLIVRVDDVDDVALLSRGRALRGDPALGPDGANVNFISPGPRKAAWRMRTYERGVEAETLACGTGAVAAACALVDWKRASLPITILSRTGQPLGVKARRTSQNLFEDVWLSGEARFVFRGVLA
jgi:diaminopimelate epimerase